MNESEVVARIVKRVVRDALEEDPRADLLGLRPKTLNEINDDLNAQGFVLIEPSDHEAMLALWMHHLEDICFRTVRDQIRRAMETLRS